MARAKKFKNQIPEYQQRLTWTRFYLPRAMTWPQWSTAYPNQHIGPLTNVQGCLKVLLGRQVNDPEQATFIILWESTELLEAFESSSACEELLRDLKHKRESLKPLFDLQYDGGFNLHEALHGRVTLTILSIRNESDEPGIVTLNDIPTKAFASFIPEGCEDIEGPPIFTRKAYTWSAREQQQETPAMNAPRQALFYLFYRWNGNRGTPEREEASARNSEAQKSWAAAVAKVTPPVIAWEQQRWQIKTAPCYPEYIDEEELAGYPYRPPTPLCESSDDDKVEE